jgi:hypothetical protein
MGINIRLDGPQDGGGGSPPQPKGGEVEKTCKQIPDWRVGYDFTPEELAKMKEQNSSPLKYFAPGRGPFILYTSPDFQGETIGSGIDFQPTGEGGPAESPEKAPGDQSDRPPKKLNDDRLVKRATGYVTRPTSALKGPITKTDVKLKDPKADALRRKIDKRYQDTPVDDAVKDIVAEYLPGVSTTFVEDFSTVIIEDVTFDEIFVNTALNRLSLLADADWHIDEDSNMWFFQSESHENNTLISSDIGSYIEDPVTGATDEHGVPLGAGGSILKKGSAKVVKDGDEIINKVEIFNPKKEVPREETPTGEGDEKHFSFPPVPETFYVYSTVGEVTTQIPVMEDWLDRSNVDPYDAPQYTGPAIVLGVTPIVAWLDENEKVFRLTDSSEPPVAYVPAVGSITIEYDRLQTQFLTMTDPVSVAEFGLREFRLITPAGHSYQEMVALGEAMLREYSQPRTYAECTVFGDRFELGDTVTFSIPEWDFSEKMPIWKKRWRWDMKNLKREWPGETDLHLGQKPQTMDQYLGQYIEDRMKNLEEPYLEKHVPYEDTFVYRENITFYETAIFPFTP